jgi:hypothetical protein
VAVPSVAVDPRALELGALLLQVELLAQIAEQQPASPSHAKSSAALVG